MLQTINNDRNMQKATEEPRARKIVREWWYGIRDECEKFFVISAKFNPNMPHFQLTQILIDLEMLYSRIERAEYPPVAEEARRYLLGAMSNLWTGYAEVLDGIDVTKARAYMDKAHLQYHEFNHELDKLGVA